MLSKNSHAEALPLLRNELNNVSIGGVGPIIACNGDLVSILEPYVQVYRDHYWCLEDIEPVAKDFREFHVKKKLAPSKPFQPLLNRTYSLLQSAAGGLTSLRSLKVSAGSGTVQHNNVISHFPLARSLACRVSNSAEPTDPT